MKIKTISILMLGFCVLLAGFTLYVFPNILSGLVLGWCLALFITAFYNPCDKIIKGYSDLVKWQQEKYDRIIDHFLDEMIRQEITRQELILNVHHQCY